MSSQFSQAKQRAPFGSVQGRTPFSDGRGPFGSVQQRADTSVHKNFSSITDTKLRKELEDFMLGKLIPGELTPRAKSFLGIR